MKKIFSTILLLVAILTINAQQTVPSISLKTLEGKTTDIQTICKKNKIVVVSLWATWCVPCMNELDAINDIYDDMRDEVDFTLLAISIDDARTVKSVKPLVNGKNWEFDVLLDTNNDLKRQLGTASVPASFVIRNGKIVKKISGYKPGEEEELLDFLKTL